MKSEIQVDTELGLYENTPQLEVTFLFVDLFDTLGIISYVVLNTCTGKTKKVTPLMYILAVLFVLKYIFL